MGATLSSPQLTQFAMTLWRLWVSRNNCLWNNVKDNSDRFAPVLELLGSWENWKAANNNRMGQPHGTNQDVETWVPPPHGHLKISVDAAFPNEARVTGLGMCLWDSTGNVLGSRTR